MFKKLTRRQSRYKYEESAIKPNVELAIDDIDDYRHVIKKEEDLGYKGLKAAFVAKSVVRLVVRNNDGNNEEITGVISHYDDNFSQLVIITGNSLKRLIFDQIVEAQVLGGTQDEEFPD